MKKLNALLIMIIMVLSIVPAAFAEEDVSGEAVTVDAVEVEPVTDDEVTRAQVARAKKANTAQRRGEIAKRAATSHKRDGTTAAEASEDCVTAVLKRFPDVSTERAKRECREGIGLAKEVGHAAKKVADRAGKDVAKRAVKAGKNAAEDGRNGKAAFKRTAVRGAHAKEHAERAKDTLKKHPRLAAKVAEMPAHRLKQLNQLHEKGGERFAKFAERASEEDMEKFMNLPRAHQAKLLTDDDAPAKLKRMVIHQRSSADGDGAGHFAARAMGADKLKKARDRYQNAKEKYQKAKDNFKEVRGKFNAARDKLKNCEGDDCDAHREEAKAQAKEWLKNRIDAVIAHLEKIRERADSADSLSEDQASNIISDVDRAINALEDLKGEVDAAETKEDVKKIANKLKHIWTKIKDRAKRHAARVVTHATGKTIKRSEHLEDKLACAVGALDEQDIDTADIEDAIDEYSAAVAEARDKFEEAKDLLSEANEAGDRDLAAEAKELIKEAHQELREAHDSLKTIVRMVKASGGSVADCRSDHYVDIEYDETEEETYEEEEVDYDDYDESDEPVEEDADEPVEETADETAEEDADEPVEETADETVEEEADEAVEETADEPVEEDADEPVEETADEPVEEEADEPVEETADEDSEDENEEA